MKKKIDQNFYKIFLDHLPDPVIAVSKKSFFIKYVNHQSEIFFSKSNNFLNNKNLNQIFYKDSYLISYLKKIVNEVGEYFIKEIPIMYKDPVEIKCIIPEKEINCFFLIVKKFDDQKFEKNIIDNDFNILDETISFLIHEINNPLSSITLSSQMLQRKIHGEDKELIDIILNETQRIIDFLQRLNTPNSNFLSASKSFENIHEILRYSLFKIKLKYENIKIIEDFDPSLPIIEIDKSLMIQVFENLILNAAESSKLNNKSYIKISTKFDYSHTIKIPNVSKFQRQNYLNIIIEDNGLGISKKNQEKIFNPFFTSKKKGSGIGLYLVKKIINVHNGFVDIKSENMVTKAFIKLPL